MRNDYMLDMIDTFTKALATTIFETEPDHIEIAIESEQDKNPLFVVLKRFILAGKINAAEDFLFEFSRNTLNDSNKKISEIEELGEMFYEILSSKTDEFLNKNNFSREEIFLGISDFKLLINTYKI